MLLFLNILNEFTWDLILFLQYESDLHDQRLLISNCNKDWMFILTSMGISFIVLSRISANRSLLDRTMTCRPGRSIVGVLALLLAYCGGLQS